MAFKGLMYILKYKIQRTGWLGDLTTSMLLHLDDETLCNSYTEFIIKIVSTFCKLSEAFYLNFTL